MRAAPPATLYAASVALLLASAGTVLVTPSASADPATATVLGTVTVPAGYFAEDVQVTAYQSVSGPGRPEWRSITGNGVQPDGSYALEGLAPGAYRLGFRHPGLVEEFYDDVTRLDLADDPDPHGDADRTQHRATHGNAHRDAHGHAHHRPHRDAWPHPGPAGTHQVRHPRRQARHEGQGQGRRHAEGRPRRGDAGSGTTVRIQWLANGKRIKGATRATLAITRKLAGKKVQAQVRATAPGHAPLVSRTKPARIRR